MKVFGSKNPIGLDFNWYANAVQRVHMLWNKYSAASVEDKAAINEEINYLRTQMREACPWYYVGDGTYKSWAASSLRE